MENDVLEFAREMERLFLDRCDINIYDSCRENNYDECLSRFEDQVCTEDPLFSIPTCGSYGSLWDFRKSNVRVPRLDYIPLDTSMIEAICFSRKIDTWILQKKEKDKSFWHDIGFEPLSMYFGSPTGAFRIFPARQSENCGEYDPRLRPWYIAGSSGPKNIVLLLDTSGSMRGARIELMKQGVKRIIETLTIGDRFSIVEFNTKASIIGQSRAFHEANFENRKILLDEVDKLQGNGSTNFLSAFETAFNIIDESMKIEANVNCHTAILFLTDGEMTDPADVSEEDIINLVGKRIESIKKISKNEIILFTYSVSEYEKVHTLPSRLACSVEIGVWSKINDENELQDALASYYYLFALGLGADFNKNFTAWVEPYTFATGNKFGTTVSAPVYDRLKSPHLFLGVVGIDFQLAALENALTEGMEDQSEVSVTKESISRIAILSSAYCPRINFSLCELESYRRRGAQGNDALCTNECNEQDFVVTEAFPCSFISDFPDNLWKNVQNEKLKYSERACCSLNEQENMDGVFPIVLSIITGVIIFTFLCFVVLCKYRKKSKKRSANNDNPSEYNPDYIHHASAPALELYEEQELPPPITGQIELLNNS